MKFPLELHKELVDMIKMKGLDPHLFTFVKRKGRIITLHRQKDIGFSFIRKDESYFDESTGTFGNRSSYLVKVGTGKEIVIPSWNIVRNSYLMWLESFV